MARPPISFYSVIITLDVKRLIITLINKLCVERRRLFVYEIEEMYIYKIENDIYEILVLFSIVLEFFFFCPI